MHSQQITLPHPLREVRLLSSRVRSGEDLEQKAYLRGRQDAEKELREQMIAQRSELSVMQQGVLKSMKDSLSDVCRQTESLLIDLALEVATKLVASMPVSAELVSARVKEALAQAEHSAGITVQIHPEDARLLEGMGAEAPSLAGSTHPLRFMPDPSVERGGCRVQTSFGLIDNQPSTAARKIREAMTA